MSDAGTANRVGKLFFLIQALPPMPIRPWGEKITLKVLIFCFSIWKIIRWSLRQSGLKFKYTQSLEILLKCRFWFNSSGVALRVCISDQLPRECPGCWLKEHTMEPSYCGQIIINICKGCPNTQKRANNACSLQYSLVAVYLKGTLAWYWSIFFAPRLVGAYQILLGNETVFPVIGHQHVLIICFLD